MDPGDRNGAREPMAEPAALPWGLDKAEVQKSSLTELTDEKLARFVIGQQKKTKFEKEREEREIKKRKADEEAAAMYAKFVASFEDEDDSMGKAFVRGGAASDDAIYRLKGTGGKKKVSDMDRLMAEKQQKESTEQESFLKPPMKKKRREMDLLVEEIKSREPTLPTANEIGPVKGSFDHATTNLYVGNLAPTVTEEALERVFGKFGRIFSVKVMWPRTEEEKSRRRMSGFVSFYERRAADEARMQLNDSELDGQRIVVGWGKAVKIEATIPSPFGSVAQSVSPVPVATAPVESAVNTDSPKIVVRIPQDERLRKLIDRLASYVAKDGEDFEVAVRFREAGNPQYAFLDESHSEAGIYYRWRVFAFAMGDSGHQWREAPFPMTVNGSVWVPPPVPTTRRDHQNSGRESRVHSRSRSRARRRSPGQGRSRSRSSTRSRSRGSSRPRSRRRSRSGSRDRRRRRSRSRSVSRSRSTSSDDSAYSRRRRSSRSRSRVRDSARASDGGRSSSRHETRHRSDRSHSRSRSRSPYSRRDDPVLKKDESLLTGQQLARARDLEHGREPNRLPREEHDRFVALLDNITLERESIKQAMGCALDNSESAVELVHMLRKRFHREDVSAVQLIGYLYVASDLLHNSSAAVKNASLFRTTFQECLPEIVDRLRRVHRAMQGRMSANAMRDKVLSVLTAWESWSLFPPHYLVGLNATFMRKVDEDVYIAERCEELMPDQLSSVEEEKLRKACAQAGILSSGSARDLLARLQWLKEFTAPATAVRKPPMVSAPMSQPTKALEVNAAEVEPLGEDSVQDGVDGEPLEEEDEKLLAEPSAVAQERLEPGDEDLDGEPLDEIGEEDLDGEPLDEADAQTEEDLDGEPLDEDDVDGEPLDEEEDLDGEPM